MAMPLLEQEQASDNSEDEEAILPLDGRGNDACVSMSIGASTAAAAAAGCAETASPGLRLRFSGGSSGAPRGNGMGLSWHDGRFSDWPVTVGQNSYGLHAFLLARASLFFESHMSVVASAELNGDGTKPVRGSNLTDVIPVSCHSAFEDALDFIYSENQAAFEAPASKALLLLKIADILQISGLFEAMGQRIESTFTETAPLLLDQYCRFHIPGTDDGAALNQLREGAMNLVVRKFQPFLANPETKAALLRLPAPVLAELLNSDELLVSSEDVVFNFVMQRIETEASEANDPSAAAAALGNEDGDLGPRANVPSCAETLIGCVRWACVSSTVIREALLLGSRLRIPEVIIHALSERAMAGDLCGTEIPASPSPLLRHPRHPILPPGVPPPTSIEIDFCFHYGTAATFSSGESLRSQPKKVGDLVLRVLAFPCGTDTGVAHGSLSVFLEAVPQPLWPRDWEFTNIRYALACLRWPSGSGETWAAKRKTDLWTFKANRLDRGWHDFLSPGEVQRYLSPDGFVCLRGSLDPECLGRAFLFSSHGASQGGYTGPGGDAAGSSGSRRSWAPPRIVGGSAVVGGSSQAGGIVN
eukprot:TRINITY_DN27951_c0_g1_i1.p1 TRINITY_DN27951_c0_g1~~TRINITY_DN27951_c0_g1_i1.p1  ORF type:complete len:587 (+),score=109.39 TRINITY_DN27951_c0_g1_i1:189-1949(+)